MNVIATKIKLIFIFIICTELESSYSAVSECTQSINEVFKKCDDCTTVKAKIHYIIKFILPKFVKNEAVNDYIDQLYFSMVIKRNISLHKSFFCSQLYIHDQKNCERFFKTIGMSDHNIPNNLFNIFYNHTIIMWQCKKEKNIFAKEIHSSLHSESEQIEILQQNSDDEVYISSDEEGTDSLAAFKQIVILQQNSDDEVHTSSDEEGTDSFADTQETENVNDLRCPSEYFTHFLKQMLKSFYVKDDNLDQIESPTIFCKIRDCNEAIENYLFALGNCHTIEDYVSNIIYFVEFNEVKDDNTKEYIHHIFNGLKLSVNVSDPNTFCNSILWGNKEDCQKALTEAKLEMGEIESNVKNIFYNRTLENVQNRDKNFKIHPKYFNPVKNKWQKVKSLKFGLKFSKKHSFKPYIKKLNMPFEKIIIEGDGNCLFRALSMWITGSENSHSNLRSILVKFMKESDLIADYLGGKEKLMIHLTSTEMEKDESWGTEAEIYAAAVMLETTIYVYSSFGSINDWSRYYRTGGYPDSIDKNEECMYIENTNGLHYDFVKSVQGPYLKDDPEPIKVPEQDPLYFNPVTHEWQKAKCAEFDMKVRGINLFYLTFKKLNIPLTYITTQLDGNCFFRALSVVMTGDESSHITLRKRLVEFMKKSSRIIEHFGGADKLNDYITENKIEYIGTSATENEIYAAALMLNTTIMVYNRTLENNWKVYYKSGEFLNSVDKHERCIYLLIKDQNHYYHVVTSVEEYPNEINYYEKYIIHISDSIIVNKYCDGTNTDENRCVKRPEKFCVQNIFDSNDLD